MFSHVLISITFGCSLQLLLQTSPVHSAIIPQLIDITTTNPTLDNSPAHCTSYEGWVGNGILRSDCAKAISEFYRTNVEPRSGQEYEFLSRGVPRTSYLPYIVTPRKYDYGEQPASIISIRCFLTRSITIGTCVVVLVMLDTFHPGSLPGSYPQRYTRSDTATFNEIYDVAVHLSSNCVKNKVVPEAGWSFAGKSAYCSLQTWTGSFI